MTHFHFLIIPLSPNCNRKELAASRVLPLLRTMARSMTFLSSLSYSRSTDSLAGLPQLEIARDKSSNTKMRISNRLTYELLETNGKWLNCRNSTKNPAELVSGSALFSLTNVATVTKT